MTSVDVNSSNNLPLEGSQYTSSGDEYLENPQAKAVTKLSSVDSVTKFEVIDDQNVRISGKIVINDPDTNEAVKVSLDPSTPEIASPQGTTSSSGTAGTTGTTGTTTTSSTTTTVAGLKGNSFFNVSTLAVFLSILADVLALMQRNRYVEAQFQITGEKLTISMSKDSAGLTKMSFDAQSQMAMMSAITNFMSAGINAFALVQMRGADMRTKKMEGYKLADDKVKLKQQELKILQRQHNVATDPNEKANFSKKIDEKQLEVNDAVTSRSQIEVQLSDREMRTIMTVKDIALNVTHGVNDLLKAGLLQEQGAAESAKQILEGYLNVLRTYVDNSGKYRDDAKNSFDEMIRFIEKIVDADIKAHYLGHPG